MATDTIVDVRLALKRLDGDRALYNELVELYLQDTPLQLSLLETAITASNRNETERIAHSLKSASGTVGATTVSEYSRKLETAARTEGAEELVVLFHAVEDEFEKIQALLYEILVQGK